MHLDIDYFFAQVSPIKWQQEQLLVDTPLPITSRWRQDVVQSLNIPRVWQVEERRDPSLKSKPMGVQQNMEVKFGGGALKWPCRSV